MNESEKINRMTLRFLRLLFAGLGLYLFFRYLFLAVLPFAAAFVFACLSRKTVLFLCEKLRLPRILSVLVFTFLLFGLAFGGAWLWQPVLTAAL